MNNRYKLLGLSGLLYLLSFTSQGVAGEFARQLYEISLSPLRPTTTSNIKLVVQGSDSYCTWIDRKGVQINFTDQTIDISLDVQEIGFLCPPPQGPVEITLGVIPDFATYRVSIFEEIYGLEQESLFHPEKLVGRFYFDVLDRSTTASPETPAEGSVQSGVGVIRGWACDAALVEVQFDDLPRMTVAYGTSRADTKFICGDDDNGYGMVFAWGLLGHGLHTMKTFIDDVEISHVSFVVAGLDEPFIKGLSGTYRLANFPQPGQSVTVQWSEADQNFIITGRNN
jgi:hypothetical protein